MVLVWWLTCISCNPVCFKDFSQYYGNLKKLCLNYYSKRSYYKYMVVFATYERGDRKEERGWTDKFFLKPKLSFQISKGKSSLQETSSHEKNIYFLKQIPKLLKKKKKIPQGNSSLEKTSSHKKIYFKKKNSQIIKK